MPRPYCWNFEPFERLARNLGIGVTDLGFLGADSSAAQRREVERSVRTALDDGQPCALLNMEFQLVTGYDEAGFDTFGRVLADRSDEIAAVMLEPLVQAAGGMKFHDPAVLRRIAALCGEHDVLLILDEIATGFCRTGTMFACEQAGVCPDILTLSKSLTGGTMALAATVATDRVYDAFLSDRFDAALMHGPTYTGNPLACAAANASLDLFEREPRQEQAKRIEAQLVRELQACAGLPGVADVRCLGAIGVVQLSGPMDLNALRGRFVEKGVWIRPFGDIVYVMPPLVIEPEGLAVLTGAIIDVVGEWSAAL